MRTECSLIWRCPQNCGEKSIQPSEMWAWDAIVWFLERNFRREPTDHWRFTQGEPGARVAGGAGLFRSNPDNDPPARGEIPKPGGSA